MSASLQRIVIACNQIDAMADFYEAVLDGPFEKVDCGEFLFYDGQLDDLALRLFPANIAGIDADENRHQLMFAVESLEAVIERGTSRGGEMQGDMAEDGERRVCCLVDPDGNTVEFVATTSRSQT
jgi:predicted enzyme related to lactoylglutathione lyase